MSEALLICSLSSTFESFHRFTTDYTDGETLANLASIFSFEDFVHIKCCHLMIRAKSDIELFEFALIETFLYLTRNTRNYMPTE